MGRGYRLSLYALLRFDRLAARPGFGLDLTRLGFGFERIEIG